LKVRKPANIKRARAKVSPENIRAFIKRLTPNMEGVKAYNVFNYDESPFRDDPAAEDAFFPVKEALRKGPEPQQDALFCYVLLQVGKISS
jgi:hypothetical protein